MNVIDNFLAESDFLPLQTALMGSNIYWRYQNSIVQPPNGRFQFNHTLFWEGKACKDYFPLIEPCLSLLNVGELYRIKANLTPQTFFHRENGFHYDPWERSDVKNAVLYINTNNGYTKFKKGGKVRSVANRMVIFDTDILHSGYTCTDEQVRVVVNFNYKSK